MATPLQALDRALKDGSNATEVMARLTEAGFAVLHVEGTISAAGVVLSCLPGVTQPEAVARTVITSAMIGAQITEMMGGE